MPDWTKICVIAAEPRENLVEYELYFNTETVDFDKTVTITTQKIHIFGEILSLLVEQFQIYITCIFIDCGFIHSL